MLINGDEEKIMDNNGKKNPSNDARDIIAAVYL